MAQKQHRVAKVYLKHFSQSKVKPFLLHSMDKVESFLLHGVEKHWVVNDYDISELTITDGEFDLANVELHDKDALERFFSKIEDLYPSVVRTIRNRQLHEIKREDLAAFVASLIVRSRHFRIWMESELQAPTLDNFLRVMVMYMKPDKQQQERIASIKAFAPEHRLNHATYSIWHHLHNRLIDKSFNMVLIENTERGWETCDDPVAIRNWYARGGSLLGRATEIFFPICEEWCLFMYDPKCRYPLNPLRRHPHGSFIKADEWIRFLVRERIFENAVEQIFFSRTQQFEDLRSEPYSPA